MAWLWDKLLHIYTVVSISLYTRSARFTFVSLLCFFLWILVIEEQIYIWRFDAYYVNMSRQKVSKLAYSFWMPPQVFSMGFKALELVSSWLVLVLTDIHLTQRFIPYDFVITWFFYICSITKSAHFSSINTQCMACFTTHTLYCISRSSGSSSVFDCRLSVVFVSSTFHQIWSFSLPSLSFQRLLSRLCLSHPTWPPHSSTAPTLPWHPTVAPLCFSCSAASNVTFWKTLVPLYTTQCAGSMMTFSLWSTAACLILGLATCPPSTTPPPPTLPITRTVWGWLGRMSTHSDPILAFCSAACPACWVWAERWADYWDWPERLWMQPKEWRCPENVDVA